MHFYFIEMIFSAQSIQPIIFHPKLNNAKVQANEMGTNLLHEN